MNKNVSNKITIINFIMTIFICNYHFPFLSFGYSSGFMRLKEFFGFLAMATFFLLSGFLLYQNAKTPEQIKAKVHKRTFSLLIPYFIWNALYIIYILIRVKTFNFSFSNLMYSFFYGPINGAIWYLLAIYILSLLAPLVVAYKNNKKLITFVFALILIKYYLNQIGITPYLFSSGDWWWYYNMIGYLPYYMIGAYVGMYYQDIALGDRGKWINLIAIVIFICCSLLRLFWPIKYLSLPIAILIVVSLWFSLPNKIFRFKFNIITQNSFFMYVMHNIFLIPFSFKMCSFIFLKPITSVPTYLLLCLISTLIMFFTCCAIVTFFKILFIKNKKAFMLLSGNRVKNDFILFNSKRRYNINQDWFHKNIL